MQRFPDALAPELWRVRPEPAIRPTRYVVVDPRPRLSGDGQVIQPPEVIPLLPITTDDPFEEVVTVVGPNSAGWTWRIHQSPIGCQVTQIACQMDVGGPWHDILRRVDTGQELGCATRYRVPLRMPGEVDYNPTFGGAADPDGARYVQGDRSQLKLYGSVPLRMSQAVTDGVGHFYAEVRPMHFGDEIREGSAPTDTSKTEPGVFWRFRQMQELWVHEANIPNLLSVAYGEYMPIVLGHEHLACLQNTSLWLTDNWGQRQAYFYIPETGATWKPHQWTEVGAIDTTPGGRANWDLHAAGYVEQYGKHVDTKRIDVNNGFTFVPESGLVAAIMQHDGDGPCVALLTRIQPRGEHLGTPDHIGIGQHRNPRFGRGVDSNSGQRITARAGGSKRRGGLNTITVRWLFARTATELELVLSSPDTIAMAKSAAWGGPWA